MSGFEAARTLYASEGFAPCARFADYEPSRHSLCMTVDLVAQPPEG